MINSPSKLRFLDPILVIGTAVSIGVSVILVLLGQDQISSLLIGLVATAITLLIDIIARLDQAEENLAKYPDLENR